MKCYDFDWQINEFMVYCRSIQLRERTIYPFCIYIAFLTAIRSFLHSTAGI